MRSLRIYVDTSVIGGCFDSEFASWSQELVTSFERGEYTPVLSELILAEIQEAPEQVIEKYKQIETAGAEFVEITTEASSLATAYLNREILDENFFEDLLHISLATISEVDLVVSWNFKHIVKFDKIRRFNAVNLEEGYKKLDIYSPREVVEVEE